MLDLKRIEALKSTNIAARESLSRFHRYCTSLLSVILSTTNSISKSTVRKECHGNCEKWLQYNLQENLAKIVVINE